MEVLFSLPLEDLLPCHIFPDEFQHLPDLYLEKDRAVLSEEDPNTIKLTDKKKELISNLLKKQQPKVHFLFLLLPIYHS